jgi:ParB-like chromosome segregation protein Spo0J
MKAPSPMKGAFEKVVRVLPLGSIMPSRPIDAGLRKMPKYRRIVASIPHVGLVEPLVVVRADKSGFRLLDGHARFAALMDLGIGEARCLIALDDEAFTYNKRISHLAAIQEHYMILKALARGASEQRIADALNLDVAAIKLRRNMLEGICPEVVELLKSKSVNIGVFGSLKRMKPLRQIEATELMLAAGNLSASYAKVLLAGTRPADLVKAAERKHVGGLTPEQMARMQHEMESVQADFKAVEKTFGDTVLQLVVATGYIGSLIRNAEIGRFMDANYPEILAQFKSIVQATSLEAP